MMKANMWRNTLCYSAYRIRRFDSLIEQVVFGFIGFFAASTTRDCRDEMRRLYDLYVTLIDTI